MSSGRQAARDLRYGRRGGGWIEDPTPPRRGVRSKREVVHRRDIISPVTLYALRWVADLLVSTTVYSACPTVARAIWFDNPPAAEQFEQRLRALIERWHDGPIVVLTPAELHQHITDRAATPERHQP